MSVTDRPGASEIADMLNAQVDAVAPMIFPNAVRVGKFLCVGSIHGEPGMSLKIHTKGPRIGGWADYSRSRGEKGGSGDMLTLWCEVLCGGDMKRALKEAAQYLALDTMDPKALERQRERAAKAKERAAREKAQNDERKRRDAEGLWLAGAPLTPSSPPVLYLENRGIDFSVLGKLPGAIRFHHRVIHAEMSKYRNRKVYEPAMVTKINAPDGSHAGTHVTYLHRDGARGWIKLPPVPCERMNKATGELEWVEADCAKKIHSPTYWGGHMQLWKGEQNCKLADIRPGTPLEVPEGIEDGLSYAMANPHCRIVAGGTLGNIGAMIVPPQAGDFNLLAQNDTKAATLDHREAVIRQQQEQARAQGSSRTVRLRLPPPAFKDWNDWLRGVEA